LSTGYPLYAWSSSAKTPIPVYQDWQPIIGVSGSKLYMTTPDGNVRFSAIGRPRIWNSRTADDIEDTGVMYYGVNDSSSTTLTLVTSEPYDDSPYFGSAVAADSAFAQSAVEYLADDGTWIRLSSGSYSFNSVTPAWATSPRAQVSIGAGSIPDTTIWRVRLLVVPALSIVDGCNVTPVAQRLTADGATTRYLTTFVYSAFPVTANPSLVTLNGAQYGNNTLWDFVEDASGVTAIQFKSFAGLGNATVNFDTSIAYTSATSTDLAAGTAGCVVTANGATLANPADYTVANNAGNARIVFAVVRNGQTIVVKLVPASGRLIVFDPSSYVVLPGRVKQDGVIITVPGLLRKDVGTTLAATNYLRMTQFGPSTAPTTMPRTYGDLVLTTYSGSSLVPTYNETSKVKYPKEANSTWYAARHAANLTVNQGTGETGSLNVVGQTDANRAITSLVAVKDRLAISDTQYTQLWQVDPDPLQNRFLDRMSYGSSSQGGTMYGMPVLNTQRGIQAVPLAGLNFQGLDVSNIGEPLLYLGAMTVSSGRFWPQLGSYVAFAAITNPSAYADMARLPADSPLRTSGTLYAFLILSYSKESGTLAWSVCPVDGVTSVDQFSYYPEDGRLYFHVNSGFFRGIYYFDEAATVFTDSPNSTQVQLYASTHYVHAGAPNRNKRLLSLTVAGRGRATFTPMMQPWLNAGNFDAGATVDEMTYGTPRIGITGTGPAVAFNIKSTDPAGYELQSMVIDLIQLGR
jgi:hypothetical protein